MSIVKVTRDGVTASIRGDWVSEWEANGWAKADGSKRAQAENQDDLDDLSAEQLHELAKDRGVKVHANAGAEKVREALRNAE